MQKYRSGDWMFLNCNSPADLAAEYGEDGVLLKEYDRCRNGHILVSDFFVDSGNMEFTTVLEELEDGAGAGLYFGDGCYSDYILAVVEQNRVSVRIPNGVPLGDTFRYEGGKRYYELGEAQVKAALPLRLCIKKRGNQFTVNYNGKDVLSCELKSFSFYKSKEENRHARIMLQAVNNDTKSMVSVRFGQWQAEGKSEVSDCGGNCIWEKDGSPAAGVSLHLAGFRNQWTETDEKGAFVFPDLPMGTYHCVAGCEAFGFWHFELLHHNSDNTYVLRPAAESVRENIPQKELTEDVQTHPLNGIWRFEWDKDGIGEKEGWFCPGHRFTRRIRVPFSWQSLAAFGEEWQADAYTLHQNCSWVTNAEEMGNTVWYQREIYPEKTADMEVVFAAVAGYGTVWLNERKIGHTTASYEPFRFSLGRLTAGEKYLLTVKVTYDFHNDCYCQGKQGFWFTDAPGIWQNVWLEESRTIRIRDILVDYELSEDNRQAELSGAVYMEASPAEACYTEAAEGSKGNCCRAEIVYASMECSTVWLCTEKERKCRLQLEPVGKLDITNRKTAYFILREDEKEIWLEEDDGQRCKADFIHSVKIDRVSMPDKVEIEFLQQKIVCTPKIANNGKLYCRFRVHAEDIRLWEMADAYQYSLEAKVLMGGRIVGTAARKVGFRRSAAEGQQFLLNGQPIFIRGVLDQGYNPWGIYTYPLMRGKKPGSMEYDISKAKEYGYNLIRMHIKDNEPDWYSLCDEYGMLVWDEHPSNFYGVYGNKLWRNMYERQLRAMIRKQNYHPSVVLFSVFNESWGIMGDHELSPWEKEEGQRWQKEEAHFYKKENPHVLAVDNSGYGKTEEADFLDYHMYPDVYSGAEEFFRKMAIQNYEGSVFNCYNESNRELMQDESVRRLLQGNCRIDLKNARFTGSERQKGQPVIISEFVHTNQIEQMVRIVSGIAGYTRMNLSSQENEDTSPLMNIRVERDFGYVHEDFSPAGYQMANNRNLLLPDYPPLTIQQAGSQVKIPVYVSLWEPWLDGRALQLRMVFKGTDVTGREGMVIKEKEVPIRAGIYKPVKVWEENIIVPGNMNALHLFFELYGQKGNKVIIAENYLQMEIQGREEKETCGLRRKGSCSAAEPVSLETDGYSGTFRENGRELLWMSGKGSITYHIPVEPEWEKGKMQLQLELSTCECLEGTRLTDELRYGGKVKVTIGSREEQIEIPDAPCDRRALFSNSAFSDGKEVCYRKTGKWGYGYQFRIPVEEKELLEAARRGFLEVTFICGEEGMVVYGSRMGRYGVNPMLTEHTV